MMIVFQTIYYYIGLKVMAINYELLFYHHCKINDSKILKILIIKMKTDK